jgi:hypothetical protein
MKHFFSLTAIVIGFAVMFLGYQAIILPVLSEINPAAVHYFATGG